MRGRLAKVGWWLLQIARAISWILVFFALQSMAVALVNALIPLPREWPLPARVDLDECPAPAFDEDCEETPPSHFPSATNWLGMVPVALLTVGLGILRYMGPYHARRIGRSLLIGELLFLAFVSIFALIPIIQIAMGDEAWISVRVVELRMIVGQCLIALGAMVVIWLGSTALIRWERRWWSNRETSHPLRFGLFAGEDDWGRPRYLYVYRDDHGIPSAQLWKYNQWVSVPIVDNDDFTRLMRHGREISREEFHNKANDQAQ